MTNVKGQSPTNDGRAAIARLEALEKGLAQVRYLCSELDRKSQGTTLANKRVAQLADSIEELKERNSNGGGSPIVVEAIMAEITRVEKSMQTLFGDLETQLSKLRGRVDVVELKLVNHNERIEANASAVAWAHARVDRLTAAAPVWAWIVATIGGIIAGVLFANHEFSRVVVVGQSTTTFDSTADEAWVAWVFGLATFAIVMWVISQIIHMLDDESSSSASSGAAASVSTNSNTNPPPNSGDEQEDTRVMPDTQSQGSGDQSDTLVNNPPPPSGGTASASAGAAAVAS